MSQKEEFTLISIYPIKKMNYVLSSSGLVYSLSTGRPIKPDYRKDTAINEHQVSIRLEIVGKPNEHVRRNFRLAELKYIMRTVPVEQTSSTSFKISKYDKESEGHCVTLLRDYLAVYEPNKNDNKFQEFLAIKKSPKKFLPEVVKKEESSELVNSPVQQYLKKASDLYVQEKKKSDKSFLELTRKAQKLKAELASSKQVVTVAKNKISSLEDELAASHRAIKVIKQDAKSSKNNMSSKRGTMHTGIAQVDKVDKHIIAIYLSLDTASAQSGVSKEDLVTVLSTNQTLAIGGFLWKRVPFVY